MEIIDDPSIYTIEAGDANIKEHIKTSRLEQHSTILTWINEIQTELQNDQRFLEIYIGDPTQEELEQHPQFFDERIQTMPACKALIGKSFDTEERYCHFSPLCIYIFFSNLLQRESEILDGRTQTTCSY
jgi:hypothetical protein